MPSVPLNRCRTAAVPLQGREKINLIAAFTQLGFDVLISDVDTAWLRNPIPYMQQVLRGVGVWGGWGVRHRVCCGGDCEQGSAAGALERRALRPQQTCSLPTAP